MGRGAVALAGGGGGVVVPLLASQPPPELTSTAAAAAAARAAPAQASAEELERQQELVREIELRRRMKATVVPTNDHEVRRMLRQLGEPITLFGEREVRTLGGVVGWAGVAVPQFWGGARKPCTHAH